MANENDISGKVGLDYSDFQRGVTALNQQIKNIEVSFRGSAATMDDWSSTSEGLNLRISTLNEKLALQKTKLKALTDEFNLLNTAEGDHTKEQQQLAGQMASLEKQISSTQGQIKKYSTALDEMDGNAGEAGNEVKNLGDDFDDAGKKTLSFGDVLKANVIGDVIISGLKAVANGVKDLAKAAVDSYADYEQLVGGVDTLFGNSSAKVQEYAADAYKTAGMSANAYMETVTSFSASLLQSLDGDTNAAADAANQALTDMSDNANKMGTDMTAIQNAYQGFAKNNYGMLDNLKLGYGGTKEEMERLLEDAGKLSGQKYDISSLNDVYNAIHVVQTEMGVTGTTAKEAATTITGSMDTAKAAWENFLIGLGSGENIDSLTTDLIASAMQVGENLVPVIGQIIDSLFTALREFIVNKLPDLAQSGADAINAFAESIQKNGIDPKGTLLIGIGVVLKALLEAIIAILPSILNLGITILDNLASGIESAISGALKAATDAVGTAIENAFKSLISSAKNWGKDIIQGIIDGIKSMVSSLSNTVSDVASSIASFLHFSVPDEGPLADYESWMPDFMQGLADGITANKSKVLDAVSALNTQLGTTSSINLTASTPTAQTQSSTQIVEGMVNGLAALLGSQSNSVSIAPSAIYLDGKQVGQVMWTPFTDVAAQKGVSLA